MKNTIQVIKDTFKEIDLLFTLYTGAGSYPQKMSQYTDEEKLNKYGIIKRNKFLDYGINFLKDFNPKYYMPYGGTYVLTGKFAHLDKFKGTPVATIINGKVKMKDGKIIGEPDGTPMKFK